jgi:radical SAM superfamily enzyme YgiQ (UPF0313 family)
MRVSGMDKRPRVLLINPWIYDFAAFDLWAKPLGLLYLGAFLKKAGYTVRLVDCMDRLHPQASGKGARAGKAMGTGHWRREPVPTPGPLKNTPRKFARYGLSEKAFLQTLSLETEPDLVLVTSIMTYWYPGVHHAIELTREVWPGMSVILGGAYATLCPDHARQHSGADLVMTGPAESSFSELENLLGKDRGLAGISRELTWSEVWPALELYPRLDSSPLMTSRGCPGHCPYCASNILFPSFVQRSVEDVLAEIEDRHRKFRIRDFTFFDDALLIRAETHLMPILEGVLSRGLDLRFHAPNGLHVASITRELAGLMFKAGFKTLRMGLETLDRERQIGWGGKVRTGQFEQAMSYLAEAGFLRGQVGVYLLYGLPGQTLDDVLEAGLAVKAQGGRPYLGEFSPIPGTALWNETKDRSEFDLEAEPLYHNNSFFPYREPGFSWEKVQEIKHRILNAD